MDFGEYLRSLPEHLRGPVRQRLTAEQHEQMRRRYRPTKPALDKAARKARNKQARQSRRANRH